MRRVAKELADIQSDTESKVMAQPADGGSDLSNLLASFPGPPDTPYEGGTYIVEIKIPQEYPFRPPIMKFRTKLWHPNVSSQTVSPKYQIVKIYANLLLLGSYLP
jgi:ubiquitin-conjugating enzyme (huntingtin interacting protein 2)